MRGGERCLEVLCELFPEAPLFTLLHVPGSVSDVIERRRIVTSFIQTLPRAATAYRSYLPLFPIAARRLDLREYDVVVSLSHCVAKAVRVRSDALHICYCFTPMRYVWDLYGDYFGRGASLPVRAVMPALAAALRAWDRRTASVHRFVANSAFVAERILRCYGRRADVVHSPVDVARFRISPEVDDYYLVVSALTPYKRVDLAVQAATRLGRRLLVVGTGPEETRLRRLAGPTVEWLGWRSDAVVAGLFARCRALLFPGVEDYGIVPLEAAAAGRPTIALGRGGVLETMIDLDAAGAEPPTAVFFREQSVDGVVEGIRRYEAAQDRFDPAALRARAMRFDRPVYATRMAAYIEGAMDEWRAC
ncbi:MAG TPA: glycosyltransferase [Solirubrobacteraceae bacterium]